MTDLRGVAYDAGFKQNEPRDWHGRWAYSQFEKLSNTLQIKKLEDMPDELYRSIKLHMQAVDTKASADDVERVARGVNDAFDEIEKKAPGIYNYVKNKNSWLRAPFLFLDYGPDFQGTSMTTYSDERTGDFAWFANVACIPHMTHRATTGEGINFASKWCHNHPTKDVAAQYFKLCMEHEFAHYVDLANTGGSLSRDFARVILKAAGIPKARTPSFFRDFEKKYEQQFTNFVKDNISEYALDDPTEAFAEGFNRWLTDDNFNPVLKEFFDYHFKRKWIDDDAMTDAANSHIVFHHFPDPKNKGKFKRENWREAFEQPTHDTTIGVQYFTSKEAPPSLTERAFGMAEANRGENEFERQRQHGQSKDSMVGAGMALIDPDGNALFVKRDEHGDHPGEWCFPGGKINEGESEIQAAEREVIEEIGSASFTRNYHGEVVSNDPVPFKTFLKPVQWQFEPAWLNEHTEHVWASVSNPPMPLHPGTAEVLRKLRGVADARTAEEGKHWVTYHGHHILMGGTHEPLSRVSLQEKSELDDWKINQLNESFAPDEDIIRDTINADFPNMKNYDVVGPRDCDYNCIAWAFGFDDKWWNPSGAGYHVEDVDEALSEYHAKIHNSYGTLLDAMKAPPEKGRVKLALFEDGDEFTHMARQLPDGRWTSKFGGNGKIVQDDLSEMEGGMYGDVTRIYDMPIKEFSRFRKEHRHNGCDDWLARTSAELKPLKYR